MKTLQVLVVWRDDRDVGVGLIVAAISGLISVMQSSKDRQLFTRMTGPKG